MTDKEVERNVRSTTVEGVKTPTERHVQGLGEQHAVSFGEKFQEKQKKEKLLDKFKRREQREKPTGAGTAAEGESGEPGEATTGEDGTQ